MNKEKDYKEKFINITVDGKNVGKVGLSFYDDIDALGLGSFEIFPKYRNQGYGTKAIKQIINRYKDKYKLIYCYVDKTNTDAIRFYERIGEVITNNDEDNDQYYVILYERS